MFQATWEMAKAYAGNGMAVGLFFAAVIYLFFTEKEKERRILLIYGSLLTLVLFFLPFFSGLFFACLDDEIYYRILWLIPMTAILAYAGVRVISDRKKVLGRVLSGMAVVLAIVLTGSYVYANPFFSKAQNRFHVPNEVAAICEEIVVEGREVKAVFPSEMLPFVRQYTANVVMPYGREMQVERWEYQNDLYDVMEAQEVDAKKLSELATKENCHYIILHKGKAMNGSLSDYGFHPMKEIGNYTIFLRDGADLTLDLG